MSCHVITQPTTNYLLQILYSIMLKDTVGLLFRSNNNRYVYHFGCIHMMTLVGTGTGAMAITITIIEIVRTSFTVSITVITIPRILIIKAITEYIREIFEGVNKENVILCIITIKKMELSLIRECLFLFLFLFLLRATTETKRSTKERHHVLAMALGRTGMTRMTTFRFRAMFLVILGSR